MEILKMSSYTTCLATTPGDATCCSSTCSGSCLFSVSESDAEPELEEEPKEDGGRRSGAIFLESAALALGATVFFDPVEGPSENSARVRLVLFLLLIDVFAKQR